MIARSNLSKLRDVAGAAPLVLDVGGWFQPFNLATHVLDINPYETRRSQDSLDPQDNERFSADSWVIHDACLGSWPFPDKYFDFVFCSHILEDVRDPIAVCRELCRVAKAGYLETPSRLREIFSKKRFFRLKSMLGKAPQIGFPHHRWFVEPDGSHLRFTPKMPILLEDSSFYLTRAQVGRNLTEQESAMAFWWKDDFTCEEMFVDPYQDYAEFRKQALKNLKA
jgi:ubiquinone/menaquinone biosynthesis C-methylase UbiE